MGDLSQMRRQEGGQLIESRRFGEGFFGTPPAFSLAEEELIALSIESEMPPEGEDVEEGFFGFRPSTTKTAELLLAVGDEVASVKSDAGQQSFLQENQERGLPCTRTLAEEML